MARGGGLGLEATGKSLLHKYEADELNISEEASLCAVNGIDFRSFPITDRGVPEPVSSFFAFADQMTSRVREGVAVAVHCRADHVVSLCRHTSYRALQPR